MAKQRILTGVAELDKNLKQLAGPVANRIAKSTLRAGVKAVARAIKQEAPQGKTGLVKKSIGSRFETFGRAGIVTAKAGVGVGKQRAKKTSVNAPHAHLVALGTKPRYRKKIGGKYAGIRNPTRKQLRTESTPKNDFVKRGYQAGSAAMSQAMEAAAKKALAREAAKLAKNLGSK